MTNQQGAPEALRPIQRFNNIFGLMNPEARGLYVRYEDHVAALVEAQQPTTHVQNPAEIEHVAGDVSKNGAESDMAQQPAPSAAADLIAALEEARRAINSMKVEAETAGQGDEQMMLEACETISNEGLQADMAIRAALASAPQPSPTPQADSQPAPTNTRQIAECYGDCPTDPKTCANPCKFEGRAARATADSQPAPEYVGNGMFKGETIQKAAEHWANWCDVRCMTGLSEFLRVVAARAPADSVTAPARPSKSLPYEPTSAMLIAARERDPALPIETVRAIYWSMWRTAPTPPAQAADSVLEDAARWQWLADYLIGERTDLDEGIVACATIDALRQFADAARN